MDTIVQRTVARFSKTVIALERALALAELPEHAERDAVLLRFELAAELMPKALQRVLSERGADVILPKDIVRRARAADIVSEREAATLLSVVDDRNRMVHDYSEEYALELLRRVKGEYQAVLQALATKLGGTPPHSE